MHRFSSFLLLLVTLFLLAVCGGVRAVDERPNIVFLMADDQCTYSMGCYGTPGVRTPNMDQLADDGMIFDRHYVTTAICMASRANVMTGLFEYRHGCNFMHGPLLQEHWSRSYPVLLRKAGYVTGFAGKFGFEVAAKPGGKGRLPEGDFDRWGGGAGQTSYRTKQMPSMKKYAEKYPHSTLAYGAFGSEFVKEFSNRDQPFCLSISFKAPHRPVAPDPRFDRVYEGAQFVKPANYGRKYGEHFSLQSRQGRQFERFHSWGYSTDYDSVMAKYYQQIFAIDVALGMIRKSLKQTGADRNTVVIYTSDNGFFCGSHGYGSKVLPYEESSRVPLIIYDPRQRLSGEKIRCAQLTGNVDFAPTLLALAGVKIPAEMDGRNLMELYRSPNRGIHESLPLINVWGPRSTFSLSVVSGRSKYIYWPFSEGEMKPAEEFYDLEKDRLELSNLVKSHAGVADLRRRYDTYVEDWKKRGVDYHGYGGLDVLFDRHRKPAASPKSLPR